MIQSSEARSPEFARIAGIDGCRAGWLCLIRDLATGEIEARLLSDVDELRPLAGELEAVAIDIPIGLPARGRRECDELARRWLGAPRANSVFPAPVRPALDAGDREEASEINHRIDGRRVASQSWNLYPRIRQVDRLLRQFPEFRGVVHEVHPEVSFAAWNGERPMMAGKKTRAGLLERRRIVERYFGAEAFENVRRKYRVRKVGHDDILDTFAALWTAERILRGESKSLPERPQDDPVGLRMAIVY